MPVVLSKRDIEMMKAIFEHRILTYEQLAHQFFASCDTSTARKRVNKLFREGYLKKRTLDLACGARRAAMLSNKGWLEIESKWDFVIDNPHLRTESPEHDVMLAEVVFRLRRLKSFKSFASENMLQTSLTLISNPAFKELSLLQADGGLSVVDGNSSESVFAFEYELNKKSPERYQEKLMSYYRTNELAGVLYVCRTQEILDSIARCDRAVCRDRTGFVCLALERDVLTSSDRIHFPSPVGEGVELY